MSRRRSSSLLAAALALLPCRAASADAPHATSLGWVRLPGAETCIDARALAEAVERRLGRAALAGPARADRAIEARVERASDGRGFRATFTLTGDSGAVLGTREISAVLARLAAKLPPPGGPGDLGAPGGSGARLRGPKPPKPVSVGPAAAPPASVVPAVVMGAALGALVSGALAVWTPVPARAPAASGALVAPADSGARSGDPSGARPAGAPEGQRARSMAGAESAGRGSAQDVFAPGEEAAPGSTTAPLAGPAERVRSDGRAGGAVPADVAVRPGDHAPRGPDAPPAEVGAGTGAGAAAPAAESESALLQRAQQALSGSPGTALALTGEHLARFPGGMLAQEREVIAISALVALGRTAEARARASAFLAAHPRSAHGPRISALVAPVSE